MKKSNLIFTAILMGIDIDIAGAQSMLRSFTGNKTTINLPLPAAIRETERNEKMSLTYWTTLEEPRECLRKVYPCKVEEFEPYFWGEINIENVPVEQWKPTYDAETNQDYLELRLAFNKYQLDSTTGQVDQDKLDTGDLDQVVYDMLKFNYKWNKDKVGQPEGWDCIDGHGEPRNEDLSTVPEIYWWTNWNGNFFTGVDMFVEDVDQDCVVIPEESSVTVDINQFAKFKVKFFRPLVTRGRISDALMQVGEKVEIHWMFKQSNNFVINKHDGDYQDSSLKTDKTYITILSQAWHTKITAVAVLFASLIAIII